MIDEEWIYAHRARALSPDHPFIRGIWRNGAIPAAMASATAATTSRKRGSPALPGSIDRSSTAMAFAEGGMAWMKCSPEKGR